MKVKAFICSGDYHQYKQFIAENNLDMNEYPALTETNFRGMHNGEDIIRIGNYYANARQEEILRHAEQYLKKPSKRHLTTQGK